MKDKILMEKDEIEALVASFEIVEIRLTAAAYDKLNTELHDIIKTPKKHIVSSYLGIPIVVDDAMPTDRAYLLSKKKTKGDVE